MKKAPAEPERLSVAELALRKGISYSSAYNSITRGIYGPPERVGRTLFVRVQDVDRHATRGQ